MKRSSHRLLCLLLTALLFAGCSVEPGKQWAAKKRQRAAGKKAQEPVRVVDTRSPGEILFDDHCRTCHTVRKKGGTLGPDLSVIGRSHDAAYFERMIRDPGKIFAGTVMPPFDALSVGEVDALVDYLLTLK